MRRTQLTRFPEKAYGRRCARRLVSIAAEPGQAPRRVLDATVRRYEADQPVWAATRSPSCAEETLASAQAAQPRFSSLCKAVSQSVDTQTAHGVPLGH